MKKSACIKRVGHNPFLVETDPSLSNPKVVESKWAAYAAGRFIPLANLGRPVVVSKMRPLAIPLPRTSLEIAASMIEVNFELDGNPHITFAPPPCDLLIVEP